MKLSLPEEGITILIDKPYGWTSFQLVNKTRWLLKQLTGNKKIKVGHAGTLDPLATGLMVLCAGKMTKSIAELSGADKRYSASLLLGYWSPSYDLEKKLISVGCPPEYQEEKLNAVMDGFKGSIEQFPPIFSAKKVGGKKAYDLARDGKKIELAANNVNIKSLEITKNNWPNLELDVLCSKGTYIRSRCHDIGVKYGTAGVMAGLRRTESGNFNIDSAVKLPQLYEHLKSLLSEHYPNS